MSRFLVACAILLTWPAVASAHRMDLRARVEAGIVTVGVAYDGDEDPADGVKVTFAGLSGVTNAKGECTFPAPPAGNYTITADDGRGHKASLNLEIGRDDGPPAETPRENRWVMTGIGLAALTIVTLVGGRLARGRSRRRMKT